MPPNRKLKSINGWIPDTDDEWQQMFAAMETGSDRETAILAAAYLEETLKLALSCAFVENTHQAMFEGADAPLNTFAAKIRLAEALAIVGPRTKSRLDKIRKIRNAFAHSLLPFSFEEEAIQNLSADLADGLPAESNLNFEFDTSGFSAPRRKYCQACIALGGDFVRYSFEVGGRTISTFTD